MSYREECEYGYWKPICAHCLDMHCDFCILISGQCERCKDVYEADRCELECKSDRTDAQNNKQTAMCPTCKANYWGDFCESSFNVNHCLAFD